MIEQVGIAIFGTTGVILSQMRPLKARKMAPIVGLVGQIFWFWASIASKQWGIFFMSFIYSAAWALGLYNYWFAKNREKVGI